MGRKRISKVGARHNVIKNNDIYYGKEFDEVMENPKRGRPSKADNKNDDKTDHKDVKKNAELDKDLFGVGDAENKYFEYDNSEV